LFDVAQQSEFSARLPAVLRALYLLFNEGYHGASPERAVRAELCREAMRLAAILLQPPVAAVPATYALAALMCLNAARLPARVDSLGNLHSLFNQDRSLWDHELLAEGLKLLDLSVTGSELTEYHVEAAISSIHATSPRAEATDWTSIVSLYDTLMTIRPSPIVALNRAIAVAQNQGPERGLRELRAIANAHRLGRYPFYHAAFGEFELRSGRNENARRHFQNALGLGRNEMERRFLAERLATC